MNDRQIRDEALTIASTGYETIGTALAWTSYLLAQHPDVTERLTSELRRVLAGRPPHRRCAEARIHADGPLRGDANLPADLDLRAGATARRPLAGGIDLRAGSKVYLSPYVTHRNPSYFPNPEHFICADLPAQPFNPALSLPTFHSRGGPDMPRPEVRHAGRRAGFGVHRRTLHTRAGVGFTGRTGSRPDAVPKVRHSCPRARSRRTPATDCAAGTSGR